MKLFSTLNLPHIKAINILPLGKSDDPYYSVLYLLVLSVMIESHPALGFNVSIGRPWLHVSLSVWRLTLFVQFGERV
jgi:hypothetical protein